MTEANHPDEVKNGLDADIAGLLAEPSIWVDPPPELGDRIATGVRSEAALDDPEPIAGEAAAISTRRGWMRPALLGAAASITFLFGGIVVLSALGVADTGSETFSAELISTGLLPDVGGEVDVASFESGLRIDLAASGLPRRDSGKFYAGWVETSDGDLFPVGTFHDGSNVTLWAGVELDRIVLFTVTLEEAAGPNDAGKGSSGEVVLRTEIQR